MDRYDSLYGRERAGNRDQVMNLILNHRFLAPARMAHDARLQQLLDEAALEEVLPSTSGAERLSARIEAVRHRLGTCLIRIGTALLGASAVAPRIPSTAGAIASGEGR